MFFLRGLPILLLSFTGEAFQPLTKGVSGPSVHVIGSPHFMSSMGDSSYTYAATSPMAPPMPPPPAGAVVPSAPQEPLQSPQELCTSPSAPRKPMYYNAEGSSRWDTVKFHMRLCDEGDTGAPFGRHDMGTFTPVPPAVAPIVARVPQSPARLRAGESRWNEVQQRMRLCDSGDTGARPSFYTGSNITPPLA